MCTVLAVLSACSHLEPSLETVYGEARVTEADQPPLVIVHGIFGSTLRDPVSGKSIWPPQECTGEKSCNPAPGEYSAPPPAEPLSLSGPDQPYALGTALFRVLEQFGGYRRTQAGEPPPSAGHPYYVFLYDWRRDSVDVARRLDSFLETIQSAQADPNAKVDVVAHGTGGLIVRYYLRYGTADVTRDNEFPVTFAGARFVRRVILLGTPNLGSVEMLRTVAQGNEVDGVRLSPLWSSRIPSLYQFFPHPIAEPLVSMEGKASRLDHFDIDVWTGNHWGPFEPKSGDPARADTADRRSRVEQYLERGRRFIWSLTVPAENPPVHYVVLGGACHGTAAKALLQANGETQALRFSTNSTPENSTDIELLLDEPGDGVVTKSSLLARQTIDPTVARHRYSYFPLLYASFYCARHNQLTRNYDLQNNLLHALLSVDPT